MSCDADKITRCNSAESGYEVVEDCASKNKICQSAITGPVCVDKYSSTPPAASSYLGNLTAFLQLIIIAFAISFALATAGRLIPSPIAVLLRNRRNYIALILLIAIILILLFTPILILTASLFGGGLL